MIASLGTHLLGYPRQNNAGPRLLHEDWDEQCVHGRHTISFLARLRDYGRRKGDAHAVYPLYPPPAEVWCSFDVRGSYCADAETSNRRDGID
jgi:hypothetical protein